MPIAAVVAEFFRPERQRGAYWRGSGGAFRPERQRGAYCSGSVGFLVPTQVTTAFVSVFFSLHYFNGKLRTYA